MSLLEDVFLEDEAGEAQELERVIEGDEYEERPLFPDSDDNEEKEDEAEEDKRRVDPTKASTKRVIKNPRFLLNPARLTGPRGIQVIPEHFKDFKFKGKGHEKEDLDMVLKKLEHWAYRLYPKFGFNDCLKKIETLGKKRAVMVHLQKIRSDQFMSEEAVVQKDSSDEETEAPVQEEDEFDKLLQQQIDLARATPTPGSVKKPTFSTPSVDRSLIMPKATSSPSISEEQRERMLRNRQLAEERRLAKLKNANSVIESSKENNHEVIFEPEVTKEEIGEVVARKHNRSHVIDSSDDDEPIAHKSVAVDVHSLVDDEMDAVEVNNKNETSQQNLPEVIDKLIARNHNRSHVIDSSDDDEPVINKSIVDVHDLVNDKMDAVEFHDRMEISKQNSIEVISERQNARKHNKSNVIESSDEDEAIVNQSIPVDVELNNKNKDNDTSEQNSVEVITKPQSKEAIDEVVAQKPNSDSPLVNQSNTFDHNRVDEINDVEISYSNQDNNSTKDIMTNQTKDHAIADKKIDNTNSDTIQEKSDKSDITNNSSEMSDKDSDLRVGKCDKTKVNNEHDNSSKTNEFNIDTKLPIVNDLNSKPRDEPSNKKNVNIIDEVMDVDFSDEW